MKQSYPTSLRELIHIWLHLIKNILAFNTFKSNANTCNFYQVYILLLFSMYSIQGVPSRVMKYAIGWTDGSRNLGKKFNWIIGQDPMLEIRFKFLKWPSKVVTTILNFKTSCFDNTWDACHFKAENHFWFQTFWFITGMKVVGVSEHIRKKLSITSKCHRLSTSSEKCDCDWSSGR